MQWNKPMQHIYITLPNCPHTKLFTLPQEYQISLIQYHSLVALHALKYWSVLLAQEMTGCILQAYTSVHLHNMVKCNAII